MASDYDRFVRAMPKKTAEHILEYLDENGRPRNEIERLIHRMMRDKIWETWSTRMLEPGYWSPGGWGPDTSGFSGHSSSGPHAWPFEGPTVEW